MRRGDRREIRETPSFWKRLQRAEAELGLRTSRLPSIYLWRVWVVHY